MANMMRAKANTLRTVTIIVGLVLAAAAPARGADDVAAFYKGKTLRILVGSGVGSGYDITARTLARTCRRIFRAIRSSSYRTSRAPAA